MNRILIIALLLIFSNFYGCLTPPKKQEKVETKQETKEVAKETVSKTVEGQPELAFLESIEDGRNLPSSSAWKEEQYSEFNEQTFFSYAPAKEIIDFNKIDYPLLNASIYYAASRERKKLGMKPFRFSELCEQAAFGHAQDMVKYDFYSHTSKVSGKETLRDRLELVGIKDSISGQNIIASFGIDYKPGTPVYTPEQNTHKKFSYQKNGTPIPNHSYISLAESLLESWMNSPAQRRNILNPDFSFLGAGSFHYKDAKFQNIDKIKAVLVLSSKP
ncbi:MAG: CAP domain-containing protein [Leptospira sp.]|nr:CAP domain-containing protein [Leptospira sp.]